MVPACHRLDRKAVPVTSQEHRKKILAHLVRLAETPGWKAYAWGAAKEFESINPHDLQGMQEALKQRMTAEKEEDETRSNRDGDSHPSH
jgi:hypothetical protein